MKKAVIFDLDGTLLNTLDSIAYFANKTLEKYGYGTIETEKYKKLTGNGARVLMERMLKEVHAEGYDFEKMLHDYNKSYDDDFMYLTRPYDGILDMLGELRKKGIKTAVISNKPDSTTVQVVREMMGELTPDIVRGGREGVPLKPDPTAVLEIIEQLGVEKDDCLYVGDTATDMETGKNAGLFTVGVLWGFRDREEIEKAGAKAIVSKPAEILKLI